MKERINLTMKKCTKCNQNSTHWEKKHHCSLSMS